jgi:integrase
MGMEEKKPENVVLSGNLSKRDTGTLVSEHEMWERHQRFISAATSENTRRTYRSAIRHFYAWGGALPCDSGAVLRYLLAYSNSLNPRTLALRLTALAQWHAFQGFPDPTADPSVRKTLKGITRTHGKPKKKAKALPIEDLEAIVAKLEPDTSLIAIRNNALLQIGFFGALRRSELAALMVEELAWETDGLVITLARSKTDQEGEGVSKAIPYGSPDGICCPIRALKRWLEAANIISGAVFRRVTRWGAVGIDPLSDGSINDILEACAKAADLAYVPELSSHSLRRGLATSAHRSGANFKDIKRQGGWRHDGTVQGYIEEAGRFEANAALTLLRRKGKNEASKP